MAGYEYGNTRLRAMRARFLSRNDLSALISVGSLDRMLAMLADTPYGPEVEASLVRVRGLRRLDDALRSNLARTLQQMATFYRDSARMKVGLLLDRWDLHNFRALLRLPEAPAALEDVSGLLVPTGRLTAAELDELVAQPDIKSRIDLMVAWRIPSSATAPSLARARAAFELRSDPSLLESALDAAFAAAMEERLGEDRTGAAAVLRAESDIRNLGSALRLRASRLDGEPGPPEPIGEFIGGGLVPTVVWEEVAATDDVDEIADLLTERNVFTGWDSALREWVSHGDLTRIVDRMRRALSSTAAAGFASGDVLGFDIPVAFTYVKEAEVRNLRLIGRGIVHRLPAQEVEERLEVVA